MTFDEWFEQARQTSAVAVTFEAEAWARAAYRAAGASEGQAEPVAWLHTARIPGKHTTWASVSKTDIPDDVAQFLGNGMRYAGAEHNVTPLYTHPSAEIAALRERIAELESLYAEAADYADFYRERITNLEAVETMRDEEIAALREKYGNDSMLIDSLRERIAGMEKDAGWISVKDRLPDEPGDYLLFRPAAHLPPASDPNITIREFFGRGKVGNDRFGGAHAVTHWMPLPEAPCDAAIAKEPK